MEEIMGIDVLHDMERFLIIHGKIITDTRNMWSDFAHEYIKTYIQH